MRRCIKERDVPGCGVIVAFSGAESGNIRIGDSVVVFAQDPIGLCATAGAKLMGANCNGIPTRSNIS
jgi:Zn-dependent alcohol dehydrogenase